MATDAEHEPRLPWRWLVERAAEPMAVLDEHGRFVWANQAACSLLGYSADQLVGTSFRDLTHPADRHLDQELADDFIAGRLERIVMEKRYVRADGSVIWIHLTGSLIGDGPQRYRLTQFHDITARLQIGRLWRESFAHAPVGMSVADLQGRFTAVNDALCGLLGYGREHLLATSLAEITHPDDQGEAEEALTALQEGRRTTARLHHRVRCRHGELLTVIVHVSAVPGADARPAFFVAQYEHLGPQQWRNRHLVYLALHDPMTGLANRTLLTDRLRQGLSELDRDGGTLAVLVIDLDELKVVNDRYGHLAGDQLITAAASELATAVRAGDTVARFGGDEFVVLARVADAEQAEALRGRIADRLSQATVSCPQPLQVRASIGMATTHAPDTSADDLLARADADMYRQKTAPDRESS